MPVYDFRTHSRVSGQCMVIGPGRHEVVIVEGILVFYWARIRDVFNLKLFVDTDPDTRLARWGKQDTTEKCPEIRRKSLQIIIIDFGKVFQIPQKLLFVLSNKIQRTY